MRALALISLLLTLPALACPELSGKYATCRSITGNTSGSYDLEVSQSVQDRVTVYNFTSTDGYTHESESETYRADGRTNVQTERDPDTGMTMSLSTTVYCMGNILRAKMILKLGGEVYSNLTTTIMKVGNKLTQNVTGSSFGEEVKETVVCE